MFAHHEVGSGLWRLDTAGSPDLEDKITLPVYCTFVARRAGSIYARYTVCMSACSADFYANMYRWTLSMLYNYINSLNTVRILTRPVLLPSLILKGAREQERGVWTRLRL